MSSEDDIFGRNSCFFFFPSLCVYGNASSRCPPHCGRLWNTCKRLIACYMHAHTHTHCTQRSLGGGTSADLLWNKPGAMIAETRRPSSCMVFLSRVKHCCQKQLCVCVRACVRACVCCWEKGGKTSQKGECVRKSQTMYHLHTAGCMSDTGPLLWGTIALLLNGCCLTGSHIKASDPQPDARRQGRGKGKKRERTKPEPVWPSGHGVTTCSCDGTD